MNVLITSLSRKVGLLGAFEAALTAVDGGGRVWGGDADPECLGRYFTEHFWTMPPLDDPTATVQLLAFCAAERIGLIVPTRDGELEFFARRRELLGAHGVAVSISNPRAIAVCADKLAFHEHCVARGLPTLPTSGVLDAVPGARLVVKSRRGAGGAGVAVDVPRDRALRHAAPLSEPIFQELATGVEHSVDVYVNRRGDVVEAAPRVRLRTHAGESYVTETVESPELVAAAVALAASLDLAGHVVIQGFTDGERVALIECNARVGGASTLGFRAGVDSPGWAIREALGETVEPRLGRYERGVRMLRYPSDRFLT